ncbi:MAG: molybdenum cofactor guanylyltransferase MobA [Hyphomicrobiales bacterium]
MVEGESNIVGVILAGGLARRMGDTAKGDKALIALDGRPILSHVIERLRPQTGTMVINANGPAERFSQFGLPVTPDPIDGFAGPLAGVLAGMDWARNNVPDAEWIVTVACDTPFFPADLVARFLDCVQAQGVDMACASSNERHHPVFGLWPVRLADALRHALVEDDIRKVDLWTARYGLAECAFSADQGDPFFNVNRPGDLDEAERMLEAS